MEGSDFPIGNILRMRKTPDSQPVLTGCDQIPLRDQQSKAPRALP
jgi:hypothetical protein